MVVRHLAKKVRLGALVSGQYVENDEGKYVLVNGEKVHRVNIVGTVVNVYKGGNVLLVLDDGSGVIRVKFFEEIPEVNTGDIVRVVGKVRKDDDLYISGETISKVTNPNEELLWRLEAGKVEIPQISYDSEDEQTFVEDTKKSFVEEEMI